MLKAESEGILDDVDMEKVEKIILDPKPEMKSVRRDVDEEEENKRRKVEPESGGILHDINKEESENLIPDPKTEVKSEEHLYDTDDEKENKTKNDNSSR